MELRIWDVKPDDFPATAMVEPGTVPLLASLLDPSAAWVYCQQHAPLYWFLGDPGWTSLSLPLTSSRTLDPDVVTARYLHYDLLIPTPEYLRLAPELGELGGSVRQVERPPDDGLQTHIEQHRNWYRKYGLVVGFELPHKNEWAQVVAASGALLDAALSRLRHAAETWDTPS